PEAHTGHSLAPLLRGDPISDWRSDFLCEFLAVPGSIPRWEGVRGNHMTYARYFVDGPDNPPYEFLFDLKEDPDQLTNLASNDEPHPLLQAMRDRCEQLVASVGPPMKDIGEVQRRSKKKNPA
ncbi:MAG: sulfatase/phosphatase domain-containing protein, partial [Verrucomicrobiota bacterium]